MAKKDESSLHGGRNRGFQRSLARLAPKRNIVPASLRVLVERKVQEVEAKLDIRQPEVRDIEFVFDDGAFLNWRVAAGATAIVLTPRIPDPEERIESAVGDPGPSHGFVDLRSLEQDSYEISAKVGWRRVSIRAIRAESLEFTRNEGVTNGSRWVIQHEESGAVNLLRINELDMAPVVVSIDAGLGVLNLAVAPLVGTGWRVQLKRRRTEVMTASGPPLSEIGLRQEFRLSTPEWIKANLALDGKESAWDAYITNVERPVSPIRLQWGGSSSTKPRETVRFRYTSSWAVIGEVIQMRPYWTLDQHLAVALVRLKNDEGTHL